MRPLSDSPAAPEFEPGDGTVEDAARRLRETATGQPERPSAADLVRLWAEGPAGRRKADDLATAHGYVIVLEGRGVRVRDLRAAPGAPRAEMPLVEATGNRRSRRLEKHAKRRG